MTIQMEQTLAKQTDGSTWLATKKLTITVMYVTFLRKSAGTKLSAPVRALLKVAA